MTLSWMDTGNCQQPLGRKQQSLWAFAESGCYLWSFRDCRCSAAHLLGGREDDHIPYSPTDELSLASGEAVRADHQAINVQSARVGQACVAARSKSSWANLISFYDRVTGLVDKGKVIDAIYPDFSNAFESSPHDILINKEGDTV